MASVLYVATAKDGHNLHHNQRCLWCDS